MENKKNTAFYKTDETNIANFKKRDDVTQFKCRITKEDCECWTSLFGKQPVKKPIGERAEKERYRFTQLEFDNSNSKDMIMHHGNILTETKYVEEVKELLNANFAKVDYRKSGKTCISVSINYDDIPNGAWATTDLPPKKLKLIQPQFPIGIVSFGRANKFGFTHKLLTGMKIKHYLFVENQQEEQYREWYNPKYCTLVVADNFSELKMGSTPMRNYIMNYFDEDYVWMLDDNIKKYYYFNRGKKSPISSPIIFKMIENYVLGCDNVGIASHNFNPFVAQGAERKCIIANGKCYSSMLLNTRINLRFAHRHQEDNFISIDCICKGYNTLCFNSILYDKNTSGEDKGGNHDGIYKCGDDTDGEGYKERYEYFKATAEDLIKSGDIVLKNGKDADKFVFRDETMKSKKYHAKAHYDYLANADNELVFNDNVRICFDKYLEWNGV